MAQAVSKLTKGDLIEIGMGDYDEESGEVIDGTSAYVHIDVESVTEDMLIDYYGKDKNVLYTQPIEDEQFKKWALENPASKLFAN